jgi:hypothetical protein
MNIAIWIFFGFSILVWGVDFYLLSVVIPHFEDILKTVNQTLPTLTVLVLQLANLRYLLVLPIAFQLTAGVVLKNRTALGIQIMGLITAFILIILSFLGLYLPIYQLSR